MVKPFIVYAKNHSVEEWFFVLVVYFHIILWIVFEFLQIVPIIFVDKHRLRRPSVSTPCPGYNAHMSPACSAP